MLNIAIMKKGLSQIAAISIKVSEATSHCSHEPTAQRFLPLNVNKH